MVKNKQQLSRHYVIEKLSESYDAMQWLSFPDRDRLKHLLTMMNNPELLYEYCMEYCEFDCCDRDQTCQVYEVIETKADKILYGRNL